jgi:plasmid stabilization system protein ParE
MILRVLDEADADAVAAANWYEQQRSGLGHDFCDEVERAFARIQSDPSRYARVEFADVEGDVRRLLLRRFPYLVVYQIFENQVLVLAISHASRDQDYWKGRLR